MGRVNVYHNLEESETSLFLPNIKHLKGLCLLPGTVKRDCNLFSIRRMHLG
jgi:hypothetical protein